MTTIQTRVAAPEDPATPARIFEMARDREEASSRLLMAFVITGLIFMVFPGTFLGVWNLLQISGGESAGSISPAWLQAHGHAQVFGWVGSFILGIGFYSIRKLHGSVKASLTGPWICWAMWTTGVAVRWAANLYLWQWRILLPVSALLELAAFFIFFRGVSMHRPAGSGKSKLEPWILVVISASIGLLLVLAANLAGCLYVALQGITPAFPHLLDQRYLALMAWGFLVPFVWGFSAKWMGVFLGLRPVRFGWLMAAVATNFAGLSLVVAAFEATGTWLLTAGVAAAIFALRLFEPSVKEPKSRGVHSSFPFFVRVAYAWLLIAAGLSVAAVRWDTSGGIWGASRHALTVGFVSIMIVSVGQRILPAFAGMRTLWSTKLMFASLVLLAVGCALRVSCEVLAYQGYLEMAWSALPFSAFMELVGLTGFALNMMGTFMLQPRHSQREAMVIGLSNASTQSFR